MSERRDWQYQHVLDHGYLLIKLPENISRYDYEALEQYFKLVLKQAKQRVQK